MVTKQIYLRQGYIGSSKDWYLKPIKSLKEKIMSFTNTALAPLYGLFKNKERIWVDLEYKGIPQISLALPIKKPGMYINMTAPARSTDEILGNLEKDVTDLLDSVQRAKTQLREYEKPIKENYEILYKPTAPTEIYSSKIVEEARKDLADLTEKNAAMQTHITNLIRKNVTRSLIKLDQRIINLYNHKDLGNGSSHILHEMKKTLTSWNELLSEKINSPIPSQVDSYLNVPITQQHTENNTQNSSCATLVKEKVEITRDFWVDPETESKIKEAEGKAAQNKRVEWAQRRQRDINSKLRIKQQAFYKQKAAGKRLTKKRESILDKLEKMTEKSGRITPLENTKYNSLIKEITQINDKIGMPN